MKIIKSALYIASDEVQSIGTSKFLFYCRGRISFISFDSIFVTPILLYQEAPTLFLLYDRNTVLWIFEIFIPP